MITAAFTVTVELRHKVVDGTRDSAGNASGGFGSWVSVPGCRLGTDAAVETDDGMTDTAVTSYRVRFPVGTPVTASDQVRLPGSTRVWAVDGEPLQAASSFTTFNPGPLATLTRVSG